MEGIGFSAFLFHDPPSLVKTLGPGAAPLTLEQMVDHARHTLLWCVHTSLPWPTSPRNPLVLFSKDKRTFLQTTLHSHHGDCVVQIVHFLNHFIKLAHIGYKGFSFPLLDVKESEPQCNLLLLTKWATKDQSNLLNKCIEFDLKLKYQYLATFLRIKRKARHKISSMASWRSIRALKLFQ